MSEDEVYYSCCIVMAWGAASAGVGSGTMMMPLMHWRCQQTRQQGVNEKEEDYGFTYIRATGRAGGFGGPWCWCFIFLSHVMCHVVCVVVW
jgi:hypothetical protein